MAVVGVLGPLLVRGPTGVVKVGSTRQRRLLVALSALVGQAVSPDRLAELMWGEGALPVDPHAAVQTNVARLRRLLPLAVQIETTPDGYRLAAERVDVDATAFVDAVDAARELKDPAASEAMLRAALALWRGHPYAELDHPLLHPDISRLEALRLEALERRAEALLALGRARDAALELQSLTVAEPLRESAVGLLMRAFVAAARPSDALAAYARLRARLADELGLDPSRELRELEERVLRQELLPPAPASERAADAPRVPVSSFVGREAEVSALREALGSGRIVTLCGPGGVGKSRLALHVAVSVADRYPDGPVVADLADGGPGDVAPALEAALRLSDAGAGSFVDRLLSALAGRQQLLVLDSCEHVLDEVLPLVEAISQRTSGVDLLLTSREPLRADGERLFAVAPLPPASAATLLVDRIRAVDPAAGDDLDQEGLVARICQRLDGLPLALELAAARAGSLGLHGLLAALDDPLDALRSSRRTSSRHRSLHDVMEWSYGMLDPAQQRLFDRMSVFAGPVERAAVAAVCGDVSSLPDLVDRSLVVRQPGDPARFGMLETLRAFGRSRLATDPELVRLRARHAAWACQLAGDIGTQRTGPEEAVAVRRFDDHLPDLRRAHAWLCREGAVDDLLHLSVLFGELGYLRGRADLVGMAEQSLEAVGLLGPGTPSAAPGRPVLAGRLLGLLATASWQRGALDVAERQAQAGVALAESAGEPLAAWAGHEARATVHMFRGELEDAARHAGQALELARTAGDIQGEALGLVDLVLATTYAGDDDAARGHESALLALRPRLLAPTAEAFVHYAQGERRAARGDPEAAVYLRAAIVAAESVDSVFVAGIARHTLLTSAARETLDPGSAVEAFGPLLDHWQGFGAWTQWWIAVRALADSLVRLEKHDEAALLLGALETSPQSPQPFGADLARAASIEATARAALGDAFGRQHAEGASLRPAEVVALARRLTRAAGHRRVDGLAEGRI